MYFRTRIFSFFFKCFRFRYLNRSRTDAIHAYASSCVSKTNDGVSPDVSVSANCAMLVMCESFMMMCIAINHAETSTPRQGELFRAHCVGFRIHLGLIMYGRRLPDSFATDLVVKALQKIAGETVAVDLRRTTGKWAGCYRVRVRKTRIIFSVNFERRTALIEVIDSRDKSYK